MKPPTTQGLADWETWYASQQSCQQATVELQRTLHLDQPDHEDDDVEQPRS